MDSVLPVEEVKTDPKPIVKSPKSNKSKQKTPKSVSFAPDVTNQKAPKIAKPPKSDKSATSEESLLDSDDSGEIF